MVRAREYSRRRVILGTEMGLLLATTNAGKLTELRQILTAQGLGFDVDTISTMDHVEETGPTFIENALIKARYYYGKHRKTVSAVIADDSGLEVDALGGRPGIYSAR